MARSSGFPGIRPVRCWASSTRSGRETDLACGAVVTDLFVAARAFGFDAEVRWRQAGDVAAEVTLLSAPDLTPPDEAVADSTGPDPQTEPGCKRSAAAR